MPAKKTPAYDDETQYDVKLTRMVWYRGATLTPLPVHEMSGKALNAIVDQEGADVIDRADPR
jgi:hypothetical protein